MRLKIKIISYIASICLFFMVKIPEVRGQYVSIENEAVLSISSSSVLELSNGTSLLNNSEEVELNGIIIFSGPYQFEISGEKSIKLAHLVLQDEAFVHLQNDLHIDSSIYLKKGIINLADKNLSYKGGKNIQGTFSSENMIAASGEGKLIYHIQKNGEYIFPVGDIDDLIDYSPAILTLTKGEYENAVISMNVKNLRHPAITGNNHYLNRFWSITQSGLSNFNCEVKFIFIDTDVVGDQANMYGGKFEGKLWKPLNKISMNQITGSVSELSDFSGGRLSELGVATIENYVDLRLSNGVVTINSLDGYTLERVEILNALGQSIIAKNLENPSYFSFDLSGHQGLYLIRIYGETGQMSKKIVLN